MAYFFRKLGQIPKNLLIARTDRIGDFVLTLPVFETLKRKLDIKITVLCNELVSPLLDNNPHVDEIIKIIDPEKTKDIAARLASKDFEALLVLVNDPFMLKLLPNLGFIPVRIGPLSKISTIRHYSHPVLQKRSRSIKNEAEYNLEILKLFDVSVQDDIKPRLYLSEIEIQRCQSILGDLFQEDFTKNGFVAMHPGMSGSALNINETLYLDMMRQLIKLDLNIVLTGAGSSEEKKNSMLISKLDSKCRSRIRNVASKLSLRELAAVISQSKLYIGPSTGPTHLANAVNTPVISFYPPIQVQSKTRWEPFKSSGHIFTPGVYCGQKYRCIGEKCKEYFCMDKFTTEDIMSKAELILKPSG